MNSSQMIPALSLPIRFRMYLFLAAVMLTVTLIACDEDSTGSGSDEFTIQVTTTQTQGEVLADGDGNVLYYFTPHVEGESACEAACVNNWSIFHVDIQSLPGTFESDLFGEIMVHGERPQLTYKGWPLYYFGQDAERGDYQRGKFPPTGYMAGGAGRNCGHTRLMIRAMMLSKTITQMSKTYEFQI